MPRYETRAVLAHCYRGKKWENFRKHTHVLDTKTGRSLCRCIPQDHMADECATDVEAPATCRTCNGRDPRNPKDENDGPRILKHIFQF
jgi:hypothetical protein